MNRFARATYVSLLVLGLSFPALAQTPKKVLFDHTHHEEGGTSAEWVICSGHEPDPSPANPTKETDWNGGMSALGYDLHTKGYTVQTLPASGGRITFGDSTNAQDLSKYNVFFIPECYTYFTAAEKTAIVKFVQSGGGLFLMGNHQGASRVSSSVPGSTDAYTVFNDLATNNGVANNGFGFTWIVGHGPGDANANTTSTAYATAVNPATTAIIRGSNGTLSMQDFHSFSYLKLSTANNPSVQGILSTQVSGDPSSDYFIATSTLGSGRVVAMGDSSPADDGTTTTSGKSLHNSYTINSNRAFFLNAIQYLAGGSSTAQPPVVNITAPSAPNTTVNIGATVNFQATATDPAGSAMTYAWNYGDSTTGTGLGPNGHVYMTAGTYTATFTATNALGLSSSASRIITVTVPAGNTVTANLTTPSGNVTINSGASVAFAGSGTDSSSTATLSYAWNFGDGATAAGTSASHVYTNTGSAAVSYTATFTVTDNTGATGSATRKITVNPASTGSSFSEGFEAGTKASYTTGNVTFASGAWTLNDALLGNTSSDPKSGTQSVRMRNSGKLTMLFNWATGAKTVSVKHAEYGSDASSTWGLWYSTNSGSTWTQAGSTVTTSSTTLQTATFTLNITGAIRFEIRKTDGSTRRINFDDFQVSGY